MALVLSIVALGIWAFLLVISHAFFIYNEPLDPDSRHYALFLHVKWFPATTGAFLVLAWMVRGYFKIAPPLIAAIPALALVVSFGMTLKQTRIDWDSFERPVDFAFIEACAFGSVADVDRQLAAGASLEACGKEGLNPLFAAFQGRNRETFVHLLNLGVDPNRLPREKMQYHVGVRILEASSAGENELWFLQTLLDNGMDPNAGNDGMRLIHPAAKSDSLPLLRTLLEYGADTNADGPAFLSPVGTAVLRGRWSNALVLAEVSNHESLKSAAAVLFDQNQGTNRTDLQNRDRVRLIEMIDALGIDMEQASAEKMEAQRARLKAAGF